MLPCWSPTLTRSTTTTNMPLSHLIAPPSGYITPTPISRELWHNGTIQMRQPFPPKQQDPMTRSSQPSWRPSRPPSGLPSRNDPTHSNLHKSLSCTLSYLAPSLSFFPFLTSICTLFVYNSHPLIYPLLLPQLHKICHPLATQCKAQYTQYFEFLELNHRNRDLFSKQIFIR